MCQKGRLRSLPFFYVRDEVTEKWLTLVQEK